MIEQVLQEIGLTTSESKVYLTLLSLGESKTGDILDKSGLNSGKIYEILESLQKKGLVSMIKKDNIKHYSPANPKRVIDYLEEKKQEIEQKEKDYLRVLPQIMEKISSSDNEAKIEIFTGMKGLKTAYAQELDFTKKDTLYIIGINPATQYTKEIYNFFINTQRPKRDAVGYRIRKLLNLRTKTSGESQGKNAECRYLPYDSLVAFTIIGDLSLIGIFVETPIVISIRSKQVAESLILQFETLWKIAKK